MTCKRPGCENPTTEAECLLGPLGYNDYCSPVCKACDTYRQDAQVLFSVLEQVDWHILAKLSSGLNHTYKSVVML